MMGIINYQSNRADRPTAKPANKLTVQWCAFSLGLLLAPLTAMAQSLVGEQGHFIKPADAPAAIKADAEQIKSLSAPPLTAQQSFINNAPFVAVPFPAFAVEAPTDLPEQRPEQKPGPTAPPEYSPRVKELLNEGYQALTRLDYPTAVANFRQAAELEPKNSKIWFEYSYALTHNKQFVEAVAVLQRVVQLEPASIAARSQLGYAFIQLDRVREAIDAFIAAESLDPQNYSFKLQLGYLYDRVNDKERARVKFIQASQSPELELHQKAVDALKALAPVVFARRWIWANEFYAAPTYYHRFNNFIAPFIWRSGLILSDRSGLEGYFSLRATRDTRSSGGKAPQIFEDNAVVASVGLRARPFKNALTIYGEAGMSFNLLPNKLATVKARSDYRFGTYYSRQWGKRTPNDKLWFPFNPVGELYFDVSYYSRFRNNVIGYLQAREGLRILQAHQTSLEAYGRVNLIKDSGRDFYNNLTETGIGLGFVPQAKWGVKITAEYMRGYYFGINRAGEANPYAPRYNDFRIALIYGKYLVKE